MKFKTQALTGLFMLLLVAGQAEAVQFSFNNITNNDSDDAAIGEAQMFVDVTAEGNDQVKFLFTNIGPADSSIADIYFEDNVPLMAFSGFVYTGDVSYSEGANPSNLPGGNDPAFSFSSNYSYDSKPPAQPNGVNPGEALGILFNLSSTFADILSALDNESMRIGIHVQGFASGGSEGFINNPVTPGTPVPEPATMLLFGAGLVGLAGIARRKIQ